MSNSREIITLAMTGASGAPYTWRLLECLLAADKDIFFLVSRAARLVSATETDIHLLDQPEEMEAFLIEHFGAKAGQIRVFGQEQWLAPAASGSGAPSKMVICPASMGTVSAIATGASNNLIERAADVAIKERRQLILVPRESPLSQIHLENMLKLSRMGVVILPASPGFYHEPKSLNDLVDFVVARILSQLSIEQALVPRWGE